MPLDKLTHLDSPLRDLVLCFRPQMFLNIRWSTKIESRVTPGKMISSRVGVATYIYPDLLSLKIKNMLDDPTSLI